MSLLRRGLDALDRHFFSPVSLRDLGIVRIVLVAFQLSLVLGVPFHWYISLDAQLAATRLSDAAYLPRPTLQLLMLPFGGGRPDVTLVHVVWWIAVVSGVLALTGLWSRVALLAFAYTTTLMQAHSYGFGESHHPEGVLTIALWVLALGPVSWRSIDHWRRRRAGRHEDEYSPDARWPLRIVQWVFVLAYFSAFVSKTERSGLEWYNGYTLTFYMLQDGVLNDIPLGLWLAEQLVIVRILSVITALFESTFVLAVLVPVLTLPYLVVGTFFHVGIFVVQRAPFFHFIVTYIVFLPEMRDGMRRTRALLARWRARAERAPRGAATIARARHAIDLSGSRSPE